MLLDLSMTCTIVAGEMKRAARASVSWASERIAPAASCTDTRAWAIGGWAGGPVGADFAVGQRWGTSAIRIDDVPIAAAGIPLRSSVWSPVTVAGLLPADTEQRLGSFAELAVPAIASAQSRVELAALVERYPAPGAEADRDGGPERSIGPGLAQ